MKYFHFNYSPKMINNSIYSKALEKLKKNNTITLQHNLFQNIGNIKEKMIFNRNRVSLISKKKCF